MSDTLLATGASGQLGQQVIEFLLETGDHTIIATTRSPEKLAHFADRGVVVREADFDDPKSLETAFAGADRLLLISTDALGEPGKRLKQHQTAVQSAKDAGVSHIIYTSLPNADDTPVTFAPDHYGTEQAIMESGLGYTILRNNLYMDLLAQAIPQAYQLGGIFKATGDGKAGYITREDCARAGVAALTDSFDGKRTLDISGAESLTQTEIASIATEVFGKPLSYTPVPLEAVVDGMVKAGLPQPIAETFASFDTAIAQGKLDVDSDFEALTGEKPTTVSEYLTTLQLEV